MKQRANNQLINNKLTYAREKLAVCDVTNLPYMTI